MEREREKTGSNSISDSGGLGSKSTAAHHLKQRNQGGKIQEDGLPSLFQQQEFFLAKAMHFSLTYLPCDSPLVAHLTKNYINYYLKAKIEKRE